MHERSQKRGYLRVRAPDFNGDGYYDLAIGVANESIGAFMSAGAVNVLYGSSVGLQAGSPDDQVWHQNSLGVKGACEYYDFFGYWM